MQRIHIIGGPGSGKTYIASKLSSQLNIAAYSLDDIFWKNAGKHRIREEPAVRDAQLAVMVAQASWIIEGVYHQWLAPSFQAADAIIVLTPSVWLRDWRMLKRFANRKRCDAAHKHESFRQLWHLILWNHTKDKDNLMRAQIFIQEMGRTMHTCKTLEDVLQLLGSVS